MTASAANYFQGVSPATVPWPGGIVPYRFDAHYPVTATESNAIVAGLREWELAANVKFVPYTNQASYVLLQFTNDGSGSGYYLSGSSTTNAFMVLHGLARGLMCHEGGHLLGLQHEHQRIDRTNDIVVNFSNIIGSTNGEGFAAFLIDSNSTPFGSYDFESVMHYVPGNFTNGLGDSLDPLPQFKKYYHKLGNPALSIGDRVAAANLYGPPVISLSNIVTNTADGGPGSLRAAIYYANDHPGTTIQFNIPNTDRNFSNGVYIIYLIGELPPLVSAGTIVDGTTEAGYAGKPIVALDGSQVSPEAGSVSGLHLYGTNCIVRALAINNFSYSGIQLFCSDAVSNRVQGCYLGLKPDGTNAASDTFAGAIFEFGAHNNFIGGTNSAQRNIISGNQYYGVLINGTNSDANVVLGNYIGLDASGSNAVPNNYSGVGVYYDQRNTVIGGTNTGAGNVISGNGQYGIYLDGTNNSGTMIQGNYIGTDVSGNHMVSNSIGGVFVTDYAHNVTIGGTNILARNVISGNAVVGIYLNGVGCRNNVVQGNYVGLNAGGTNALGNTNGLYLVTGASVNLIGGTNAGARNVFSGNGVYGVYISDLGTTNNVVAGNYFGTDYTGMKLIPNGKDDLNGGYGIGIFGLASNNIVGGTNAAARNVIAGHRTYGIVIANAATNFIEGNFIGTDMTGTNALGNNNGVAIFGANVGVVLGGGAAGAANVISGNTNYGVFISDRHTSGNLVAGNFIGMDITGKIPVGNGFTGAAIFGSATNNTIGGVTAGARNIISANGTYGVLISDSGTANNLVAGNYIGTDITGKVALSNAYVGVAIYGGASRNIIGGSSPGAGNIISASGTYGVSLSDSGTTGNLVDLNLIGTDISGTNALGNGALAFYGANVELQNGASGNVIGGTGNTIAFSATGPGVLLYDPSTVSNRISGNAIHGNAALGIDLNGDGVTPNHPGLGVGPNSLQNYPVITNAFGFQSRTVVRGILSAIANQAYTLAFYSNPAADPSGYGQGQFFLGAVLASTDGSGNAFFSFTNSLANLAGQYVAATATSPGSDTSEFSADAVVTNTPGFTVTITGPFSLRTNGFVFSLSVNTNYSYRIQAATNLAAKPITWVDLTNLAPNTVSLLFTDRAATNFPARFYRTVSP